MKKYVILLMAVLAIFLIACETTDYKFDDTATGDSITGNSVNEVTQQAKDQEIEALKDAIKTLSEDNKKLRDEVNSKVVETPEVVDTTVTAKSVSDKFASYMDGETILFNNADCKAGLVSTTKKFFDSIQNDLEDNYRSDVKDLSNSDLDDISQDLSDFESDFNRIVWSADLSNSNVSNLGSKYANLTFFSDKVSSLFNRTDKELSNLDDDLSNVKDDLKKEKDYDRASGDLDDASNRVDDVQDELDNLANYLDDLRKELKDKNYDNEESDVDDVLSDVESLGDDLDDLQSTIDDMSSEVDDLVTDFEDKDDTIEEIGIICR